MRAKSSSEIDIIIPSLDATFITRQRPVARLPVLELSRDPWKAKYRDDSLCVELKLTTGYWISILLNKPTFDYSLLHSAQDEFTAHFI